MYVYSTVGIYVQFSQKTYVVDESAGYAVLKVTVSGYRKIPISVNVKIFVSSEFQPAPGKYHQHDLAAA